MRKAYNPPRPSRADRPVRHTAGVIAHLDLDAFFAAVELHRRPELRRRPVVVGGDPDGRGVVATANYAARGYGIRSAMSCAEARRRCPDAVFVRPDIRHYREWSRRVWDLVGELSACVEQVGLDEGYLAVDAPAREHAERIRRAIREEIRLSCSIGVATCKVVAKIASDRDKPGGITVVRAGEEAAFLAPLPLRALPGVGPRTAERLTTAGLGTVGELAALDDGSLASILKGQPGRELRDRARGVDPRVVSEEPAERISISMERTFETDVSEVATMADVIDGWSAALADDLRAKGLAARTVTLKLRYPDFTSATRARTMPGPTVDPMVIGTTATDLLHRALTDRSAPIRLLGVGVAGLTSHVQLTLFTDSRAPGVYERRKAG
jgi:DNA polymerase-4